MHTVPAGGVRPAAISSTSSESATTRRSAARKAIWRSNTPGWVRFLRSMHRAASSSATLWYMRMIAPSGRAAISNARPAPDQCTAAPTAARPREPMVMAILDDEVAPPDAVWLCFARHAGCCAGNRRFPPTRENGRARRERAGDVRRRTAIPHVVFDDFFDPALL